MKNLIQRFLSKKRNIVILIILFLIFIGFASYIVKGVNKNLQLMAEEAGITPTYFPAYPTVKTTPANQALIKRGERLVKAGDCMACHTNSPERGKAFAGGLPMPTPFGTIYTPNITPDKETGIGNWTNAQFVKAMREGISPTGHYYYPAFPYLYFSQVYEDDLIAIKAYLDNIPSIKQANLPNDMLFPFNFRFMQLGWRLLFFHPKGAYKPNFKHTLEAQRGGYLVEGLGHCGMCHTPSYYLLNKNLPLGAPIRKYQFTGAKVAGFLAPNISKLNLGDVPLNEIVDVFAKDKMVGGGNIEGPMLEVNKNSLRYLSHSDLVDIATYLKTIESKNPPKPRGGIGKATYEAYCSGCHSSGAGGAPKYGDPNTWSSILKQEKQVVYNNAIHGISGMPAKGTCMSCTDDDIKQAVDFMIASVAGKKAIAATPKPKALSLEDGKRIYNEDCAICHNNQFKGAPKPGDKEAWKPIIHAGFDNAYLDVVTGRDGHPVRGDCNECTDAEIIAALKYMMQESSTGKNFSLW